MTTAKWTFFKKHFGVLFVGSLIPLFWTSGEFCLGFQGKGGTLTWMLPDLCVMDTSEFTFGLTPADLLMINTDPRTCTCTYSIDRTEPEIDCGSVHSNRLSISGSACKNDINKNAFQQDAYHLDTVHCSGCLGGEGVFLWWGWMPRGGCLPGGGWCLPGGGCTPPPPWTESQTGVKTLPFRNFVCER